MSKAEFMGYKDVICLSPHPDDVEYGMYGTVLSCPGTTFWIIVMSQGAPSNPTYGKVRLEEVTRCWKGVHNKTLIFTNASSLMSLAEREWIGKLEHDYSDVLGICSTMIVPPLDDDHYEHSLVSRVGRAIARSNAYGLIEYRTASARESWTPNLVVDITDNYVAKRQAMVNFQSQAKHGYFSQAGLNAFHIHYGASRRGYGTWHELFRIVMMYMGGGNND